jgi:hypothetical protein
MLMAMHKQLELEGFAALIQAGHGQPTLPEMPLIESLEDLATIEVLLQSARTGQPILMV